MKKNKQRVFMHNILFDLYIKKGISFTTGGGKEPKIQALLTVLKELILRNIS